MSHEKLVLFGNRQKLIITNSILPDALLIGDSSVKLFISSMVCSEHGSKSDRERSSVS